MNFSLWNDYFSFISFSLGMDKYSYFLMFLTFWLFILSLFSLLNLKSLYFSYLKFIMLIMVLFLFLCFLSLSFFNFYFYFECSVIPGSILGVCLMIQIVSGIFLSMHYTPNISLAFNSMIHITRYKHYK